MSDLVGHILAGLFLIGVGYVLCLGISTGPQLADTDTVYVDQEVPVTVTDTVYTEPDTRVIYQQHTDTVEIKVPVPRDMTVGGVIDRNPVHVDQPVFGTPTATLTYFDTDAMRYQQDVFDLSTNWHMTPSIGAQVTPIGTYADARLELGYQWFSGFVGYGVSEVRDGVVAGVRMEYRIEW